MKGKRRLLVVLLAVAVVAGVVFWRSVAGNNGAPVGTFKGNGVVEADEVEVSAKISGRLLSVERRVGDEVRRGELLATLDGGDLAGQAEAASGAVGSFEASLAELQAGTRPEELRRMEAGVAASARLLEQARARRDLVRAGQRPEVVAQVRAQLTLSEVALADAERELARTERLEKEGAVPGRDLDLMRGRRDAARAQAEASRQRLGEVQAGARPEEVREAEAAVTVAEAQVQATQATLDLGRAGARRETLAGARARVEQARGAERTARFILDQATILSPLDGRVTVRGGEPGEVVTPGFPILTLADLTNVWLRVYVPEEKLGLVKLGQEADITVDSYPGRVFPGKVVEIAQEPEFTPKNVQTREERVKLVFGVKLAVANEGHELKPGMPADAVIHVSPRNTGTPY